MATSRQKSRAERSSPQRRPHAVLVDGTRLRIRDVVDVARHGVPVELAPDGVERMHVARRVVERMMSRGDAVYGMNTGVAARKRLRVSATEMAAFNRLLIQNHRVGQGPAAPQEVVRAMLLGIVNGFARGTTAVRPELAQRLVRALNDGSTARVRILGSVGQSDLGPNADLAHDLLGDFELAAGEGLAVMNNNSFSNGITALAFADAETLLEALEVIGALELEAFAANLTILHPAVATARPYRGLRRSLDRLTVLLAGSYLWKKGAARNLQDPLTFRGMPQVFGAAWDALEHVRAQLTTELNAHQGNPLVVPDERRVISVWNGEVAPLAAAVDFLRIALAPVLTSANERMLKLLQAPISGLPDGLAARPGLHEDALAELGVTGQGLVAEARLLAQPVSFEMASTTQAEGIEDRMTMAPLGARRLNEMVGLGRRIAAIQLVVAAQAVDLRRPPRLGTATRRARDQVRALVPFTAPGQPVSPDLEPVCDLVASGTLGEAP